MATFLEGAGSAVKDAYCEFSSGAPPEWLNWLADQALPTWVIPGTETERFFRSGPSLSDLICNRPPSGAKPEYSPVPFSGGQCTTIYNWSLKFSGVRDNGSIYDDEDFTPNFNRSRQILGPVSDPFIDIDTGLWSAFDGEGILRPLRSANGVVDVTRREFELQRDDGQPDDCGNPPGKERPPFQSGPNEFDIDITFEPGSGGPEINLPGALVFAFPVFNVNGNVTVPFTVESPQIYLTGDLTLNTGDVNFNFGGESGNEKCCLDEGTDVDPPTTEDDPPAEEEEERDIIVGTIITCSVVPDDFNGSIYGQGDGPLLFHSRLGNIYFVVEVSGRRIWTPAISVQHRQVYIPCPAGFGAVDVVGYFRQGVEWQSTPVYRRLSVNEYPST